MRVAPLLALSLVVGWSTSCTTTSPKPDAIAPHDVAAPQAVVHAVGAYDPIDPNAESVQKAYAFLTAALKQKSPDLTLGAIKESRSQVVAGTNIQLVCAYERGGVPGTLRAVVYVDLAQNAQLAELDMDHKGN